MGKNGKKLDANPKVFNEPAFVETIAQRYCRIYSRRANSLFDIDDYRQAAWMGYLWSKTHWDANKGLAFWRYATIRMRGEILDQLRVALGRVRPTCNNIRYEQFSVEEEIQDSRQRNYVPEELIERIRTWPVMERIIIQLYFLDEVPLKSIGWLFDVTESRICQRLNEVSKKLRQAATIHEVHLR